MPALFSILAGPRMCKDNRRSVRIPWRLHFVMRSMSVLCRRPIVLLKFPVLLVLFTSLLLLMTEAAIKFGSLLMSPSVSGVCCVLREQILFEIPVRRWCPLLGLFMFWGRLRVLRMWIRSRSFRCPQLRIRSLPVI